MDRGKLGRIESDRSGESDVDGRRGEVSDELEYDKEASEEKKG